MTDPRQAQFRDLFRKLRIDEQREFYSARRDEYRNANRQAIVTRNILLVLAAVCGAAGPFVDVAVRPWLGVIAAVLGGLAAAVTGFEALIGFARLEKVYADAATNLDRALVSWDGLAAEADPAGEVVGVEEIFRKEIGQWGQLEMETPPAVPSSPSGEGEAG